MRARRKRPCSLQTAALPQEALTPPPERAGLQLQPTQHPINKQQPWNGMLENSVGKLRRKESSGTGEVLYTSVHRPTHHPLIHLPTQPPPISAPIHPPTHTSIPSPTHPPSIHPSTHPSTTHPPMHPPTHSSIYPLTHELAGMKHGGPKEWEGHGAGEVSV